MVKWHPQQTQAYTSWLELTLSFEMLCARPVPAEAKATSLWHSDCWLTEPPAFKRVAVFRAAVYQLSKLFSVDLFPEDVSVPLTHYGCLVQRQPIPGFQVRSEFPHRLQVNKFIRSTLASMRSKSTFMHLV